MPHATERSDRRSARARVAPPVLALVAGLSLAFAGGLAVNAGDSAPSPVNDNFAQSETIASLPFDTTIDITGATTEDGEPNGCGSIGHTVWYTFTPVSTTLVEFEASGLLPSVAVYTGDALVGLDLVDCDHRTNYGPTPPPPFRSSTFSEADAFFDLEMEFQAGVTYHIQAGGWDDQSGILQLSLAPITEITAIVFEDMNANGIRDEQDFGVFGHPVSLSGPDGEQTGTQGSPFQVEPGEYTLSIVPSLSVSGFCVDSFGGFYPLRLDDCLIADAPAEATTPTEVTVTIEHAGDSKTVEFGVHRITDAAVLAGVAVLHTSRAPPGSLIEAFVGEAKCGESQAMNVPAGIHNYELIIYGASERDGCAEPGDEISITIDGVPADLNFPYAFQPLGSDLTLRNLIAIEDHAWFWAEERAFPEGQISQTQVVAIIDGNACGNATAAGGSHVFQRVVGFSSLIVPSDEIQPGCGYPGATVQFRVGGEMTNTTMLWEPAISQIDIDLPGAIGSGDTNCNGDIDAVDALLTLKFVAGEQSPDCVYAVADVDCDGAREAVDALIILQFIAGLPFNLPPGCPPLNQSGP